MQLVEISHHLGILVKVSEKQRGCTGKITHLALVELDNDVDYNIMLRLGSAAMETVMKEQMYNEYDLKHIFHNVILLNIRGLCTTEGIKLLDHFLDNETRTQ